MAATHQATATTRSFLAPFPGYTKRDFLSLHDLTFVEMAELLAFASEVKAHPADFQDALKGKIAALIFEKPSLRTRVTFEAAMLQMGGAAIYLSSADIALGKREAVKDVARNLARWVNAAVVRTFSHGILEEMAREAPLPIINALSDLLHPCQAVADVMTLQEHLGSLKGLRMAFIGDGNNVAHALAQAAAKTGMHLTIACPRGYEPNAVLFRQAREDAVATGAHICIMEDAEDAVLDADAVYTDVWASMGQESEADQRKVVFRPFHVDSYLMSRAKPGALFLHCLPAHRGEEVTDAVLDSPQSVVLDQAENRLHVAKAILLALLDRVPR